MGGHYDDDDDDDDTDNDGHVNAVPTDDQKNSIVSGAWLNEVTGE